MSRDRLSNTLMEGSFVSTIQGCHTGEFWEHSDYHDIQSTPQCIVGELVVVQLGQVGSCTLYTITVLLLVKPFLHTCQLVITLREYVLRQFAGENGCQQTTQDYVECKHHPFSD